MTQRNQLDVLSCIRNIYKEVQKEIMYTLKYINDILLDINIELTYNTLISSKTIDQSLPEEEEKKVLEPPIDSPNIIYVKSISIPFITNLSISRFNSLSSKLKETTHLSELKDEKIMKQIKVINLISDFIEEMEEVTLKIIDNSKKLKHPFLNESVF